MPAWSSSPAELKALEYDAHSILTTWGDRTASADLHEYGNKDWAGLISSYYAARWKLYFASLDAALETGAVPQPIDWYNFGHTWNQSPAHYSAIPAGDTYLASLAIARALNLQPATSATKETR